MPQHLLYEDGDESPSVITDDARWRPERGDVSWTLTDGAGRVVDCHHPLKPRHAARQAELERNRLETP